MDIRRFPHQVSLRYRDEHSCGASIISPRHCLTAAHCYAPDSAYADYSVLAGSTASRGPNARLGTVVTVKRFIIHEKYGTQQIAHDIAVLLLANPLPLNGVTMRTISLPVQDETLPFGSVGAIAGW